MPVLSFVEEKKEANHNTLAYEYVNEHTKFKRNRDLFNNKANQAIRAKMLAEKEAAETKKKVQEAQDKGEGQVKVKF